MRSFSLRRVGNCIGQVSDPYCFSVSEVYCDVRIQYVFIGFHKKSAQLSAIITAESNSLLVDLHW